MSLPEASIGLESLLSITKPCLIFSNGKLVPGWYELTAGRSIIKAYAEKGTLSTTCSLCNSPLDEVSFWLQSELNIHGDDPSHRHEDGTLATDGIFFWCKGKHRDDPIFACCYGMDEDRVQSLETLCAIALYRLGVIEECIKIIPVTVSDKLTRALEFVRDIRKKHPITDNKVE
jgi:hypothetical protein